MASFMMREGLPDYLRPGLELVLVGINPGLRSAEVGHHFAGPTNRFWDLLYDSGITPRRLSYEEDSLLLDFGIGITNIADRPPAPPRIWVKRTSCEDAAPWRER